MSSVKETHMLKEGALIIIKKKVKENVTQDNIADIKGKTSFNKRLPV